MKRLAAFVEGKTEALFLEKLLTEVAGSKNILIERQEILGGANSPKKVRTIRASKPLGAETYYVLIVDCGGDHQVKTRIQEEHDNLTKAGYIKIIAMRDVRPTFTHAEIPKLVRTLPLYIKTRLIPVEFVLSVMEIEAWFLAEATHFERIDTALTVPLIQANLGFNPELDDMGARLAPADDLHACYQLVRKSYSKRNTERTVEALDANAIYLSLPAKIPYLQRLVDSIDAFMS